MSEMTRSIGMRPHSTAGLAARIASGSSMRELVGASQMNAPNRSSDSSPAMAFSAVYAMFAQGKVRHNNDPLLVSQMGNGVAKYTGETWLISRKESRGDIDALMATVIALYVSSRAQHAGVQVF